MFHFAYIYIYIYITDYCRDIENPFVCPSLKTHVFYRPTFVSFSSVLEQCEAQYVCI